MEKLINKTNFLGNYKVFVGDGKSDVVINTLGKVYIKTGNNLKLLNEIFKKLENINKKEVKEIKESVLITDNLESLDYPGDGILIFNPSNNSLYISYDSRYILLETTSTSSNSSSEIQESSEYVKKSGDTMNGTLSLMDKIPLIVASKELILNLNSEFLNGFTSKELAVKKLDELIYGFWTFENNTNFNNNISIKNDVKIGQNLIVNNDVSSPKFSEGYNGYGWKLDASTNTLTVDNLIVRKVMRVFELIINEISATNGSVWVTDSCKIENCYSLQYLDINNININELSKNVWYIPNSGNNVRIVSISKNNLNPLDNSSIGELFINIGFLIRFKEIKEEIKTINFADPDNWNDSIKSFVEYIPIFNEFVVGGTLENANTNQIYDVSKTPRMYTTGNLMSFDSKNQILIIYLYYRYFGIKNISQLKIVSFNNSKFPSLKEGDLLRCLKFVENSIKYYDALVMCKLNTYEYVLNTSPSIFDNYSEKNSANIKLNIKPYTRTSQGLYGEVSEKDVENEIKSNPNLILSTIENKDELIRIGSITDTTRQGSIYLTSSETESSPSIKILDNINRPDYNVLFCVPKFSIIKYQEKDYYYILEKEKTELNVDINGKYYKLYTFPNLQCEIDHEVINGKKHYFSLHDIKLKAQFGKLDNIEVDNEYINPKGYGLFGQNVYLQGEFVLNNGTSVAKIGEGIELKIIGEFGEAGLEILEEDNHSVITLNADLVRIKNGDIVAAFFKDGKIISDYIDVGTLSFNKLIGKDTNEQPVITINELSQGETILYYPSGNIMNCKILIKDKDKLGNETVTGCREYFLEDGSNITKDTIDQIDNSKSIVKIFDYFEIISPLKFSAKPYKTTFKIDILQPNYEEYFKKWKNAIFPSSLTLLENLFNFNNTDGSLNQSKENKNVIDFKSINDIENFITRIVIDSSNYTESQSIVTPSVPLCDKNYVILVSRLCNAFLLESNTTLNYYTCEKYSEKYPTNYTDKIYFSPSDYVYASEHWYTYDCYMLINQIQGMSGYRTSNADTFSSVILKPGIYITGKVEASGFNPQYSPLLDKLNADFNLCFIETLLTKEKTSRQLRNEIHFKVVNGKFGDTRNSSSVNSL